MFGRTVSTHFGTVSPFSMFSIDTKNHALKSISQIFIWDLDLDLDLELDLDLGYKELGVKSSCVRSP